MWRRLAAVVVLAAVLAVVGIGLAGLVRQAPSVRLVSTDAPARFSPQPAGLAWPAAGEAAVAVPGVGMVGSWRGDRAVPIASVAKVMTAYVVLHDHPLGPGGSGPVITVTPADAAIYRADLAGGQSVARVTAGEQLSERQALEALLLPSANNVATMLASWDAGSLGAFVAKMNDWALTLRLKHTRYVDASGLDSATVSSADDQVRLATAALRMPVFAQIVSLRQAPLPVAGVQPNLDELLGRDGVFGVKTGSTSAAGGCFVFATRERVGAHVVTVIGAVLGQPATPAQPTIIGAGLHAATTLISSIPRVLEVVSFGPKIRVAWLRAPWTPAVAARPSRTVSLVGWPGLPVRMRIAGAPDLGAPVRSGQRVTVADIVAGDQHETVPVVATGELAAPSFWWRVTHP
jgi:serine-type D-Ala-D-Ala carboxypeptidase (penicillin-binding protein 5/6)